MTKLFKNSKSVLSFVLAFAVLAVSLFTGAVITSEAACSDTVTDTWDADDALAIYTQGGTSALALNYKTWNLIDPELEGSGTKANPYIISSAEELAAVSRGHVASKGKYFKVQDGIKAFYMNKYLVANGQNTAKWIDEEADFDTVVKTFTGEWKRADDSALTGNNIFENKCSGNYFEGHFDGNGVVIYGLKSENPNGVGAGLFPQVRGNVTIKNVSVKKSYAAAVSAGAIVGCSVGEAIGNLASASLEGAGSLTVENCSVVDAYIKNTAVWGAKGGHGIGAIFGKADHMAYPGASPYYNGEVLVKNCFVDVDSNYFVMATGTNYVCRGGIGGFSTSNKNKYENCIVLGINPYATLTPTDKDHNKYTAHEATFTNVYTDATVENATVGGSKGTHTFANITKVDPANIKGAAADSLNLGDAWIAIDGKLPALKVFHDKEFHADDNGDGTHTLACSCGDKLTTAEQHNYDKAQKDGLCTECQAPCKHDNSVFVEVDNATCDEPAKGYEECTVCGVVTKLNATKGDKLGHELELVRGTPKQCEQDGIKDYYDCTRCNFVSEDDKGNKPIQDLDTWKIDPHEGHKHDKTDKDWDGTTTPGSHYKVCDVCSNSFGTAEPCTTIFVSIDSEGHEGYCTVCGTITSSKEAHANFDENHQCGTCDWVCPHATSSFVEGTPASCTAPAKGDKVCDVCGVTTLANTTNGVPLNHDLKEVPGTPKSCTQDGSKTYYDCTRCDLVSEDAEGNKPIQDLDAWKLIEKGHVIVKVDEAPATYEKEGTKAHYACECGKLFSDAEGKNEVTAESLTIAKLVKEEVKEEVKADAPASSGEGDKSSESPKTGESVASVAAVAALMGAAFVLARKAKK